MSEQSNTPTGGMSPNFRLDESIHAARADQGEFELPMAVAAAHKIASELTGLASDNVRLQEEAAIDQKTGLSNETTWMAGLAETIANLKPGERLTVYIVDIDNFKQVNTLLGHKKGDELLNRTAGSLVTTYRRRTDQLAHGSRDSTEPGIAHLGGDEFAIFSVSPAPGPSMPERRAVDPAEEAVKQSDHANAEFTTAIAGTDFANIPNLKLSIGSTDYEPDDTAESLFVRADVRMFEVKYRGKINSVSDEDRAQLQVIIPFLERLGTRIEPWLYEAAKLTK